MMRPNKLYYSSSTRNCVKLYGRKDRHSIEYSEPVEERVESAYYLRVFCYATSMRFCVKLNFRQPAGAVLVRQDRDVNRTPYPTHHPLPTTHRFYLDRATLERLRLCGVRLINSTIAPCREPR